MPHIPRRTPNGVGPPVELLAAMEAERNPRPRPEAKTVKKTTLGLPTIDMATWDVPPEKIYRNIFGTEPRRDHYTGELVLPRSGQQSPGGGETHATGTPRKR